MKKTHRTLLSILLALTLLASLPMTVLADEDPEPTHITESTQTNDQSGVIVDTDVTVGTNTGKDVTNNGTITNNGTEGGGTGSGTVDTNNGKIENNYGTVETNEGNVLKNDGTVEKNDGTVETNAEGGSIGANYGNVSTNEAGATVGLNIGTVAENRGEVADNGRYSVDGNEDENGEPAVVHNNSGTVLYNNDTVDNINGGVVSSNFGLVDNAAGGVVTFNGGLGTVNNHADGEVQLNIGIVNNEAGGLLNDVFITKNPDWTEPGNYYIQQYEPFTGKAATYVGTELEVGLIETTNEETGEKTYRDFKDDGICNIVKQAIQGTVLNLKELGKLFQKDDYEVVGYQEYNRHSEAESSVDQPVKYQTMYKVQYPDIWLNLIWGKAVIKPVASPAGDEAVPTSYNPNYIGLGSVIFINEKGYKVVEIKDDAYVVVTFDALPDEDVADLNALFDKLFTPEQQKLVKNMGQLLDSEDVLTIFGKPGNHPVFEFQKDLVK